MINPLGEISLVNSTYKKTFKTVNELVEIMFPTVNTKSLETEEWNSFNFWKQHPMVGIVDDIEITKQ